MTNDNIKMKSANENTIPNNNGRKSPLAHASLTIEAALIAPLLILSVMGVLYLSFHLHNRTCLYASAAEQAISGHKQDDPSYFGMQSVSRGGSESKSHRTVRFTSGTWNFNGEKMYAIEEEAEYKIIRPVKTVRRILAGKDMLS